MGNLDPWVTAKKSVNLEMFIGNFLDVDLSLHQAGIVIVIEIIEHLKSVWDEVEFQEYSKRMLVIIAKKFLNKLRVYVQPENICLDINALKKCPR